MDLIGILADALASLSDDRAHGASAFYHRLHKALCPILKGSGVPFPAV